MSRLDLRTRPVQPAGRRVRRAVPPGRAAAAHRVHRQVPRAGRRDPRAVPGPGGDGAVRHRGRRRRPGCARDAAGAGTPDARAAGRLPHPPRDRPRRHGHRLRGGAGEPGPARGAEGPAATSPGRPQPARAVPARGPGRGDAAPHQHRAGLRRRRARRGALLRHAVHPGPEPGRRAPRGQAAARRNPPSRAALRAPGTIPTWRPAWRSGWCPAGSRSTARPRRRRSRHCTASAASGEAPARPPTATGPGPSSSASSILGQSGSPYYRSVARIGVQVAEALAYAHHQGCCTATSSRPTCCSTCRGRSG